MKPSRDPSASVTRAELAGQAGLGSLADDLLRQSLTAKPNTSAEGPASVRKPPSAPPSSASLLRSRNPPTGGPSAADSLLRASVLRTPTAPPSSASLLRSRNPPTGGPSAADSLLRASVLRTPTAPPSSASLRRSQNPPTGGPSAADSLLRASLTRAAAVPSAEKPPPYHSGRSASVTRPSSTTTTGPALGRAPLSAAETKSRLTKILTEVERAKAAAPPRDTEGLFRASCSTDLLFLIDTTGSMEPYIDAAKDQVRQIVKDIKEAFLGESDVRIAVVGYKDHYEYPHIEFLDFTTSVTEVRNFLSGLTAGGGSDMPEDVLSGLRQAVNASWKQQTRCLVHIADAPAHGQTLHDLPEEADSYWNPGSEPHGLTHDGLLGQLVKLHVNYCFLRINSSTDRMALQFSRVYGGADVKLSRKNTYHTAAADSLLRARSRAKKTATGTGPLFEEMQLGITYQALRHLVVSTITSSVSRTATRLTLALSGSGGGGSGGGSGPPPRPRGFRGSGLSAVAEERTATGSRASETAVLEKIPPRWNTPGWLDQSLYVDGICMNLANHGADTLQAMMEGDNNIKLGVVQLEIHARSKPFDQGALRVATYAQPAAMTTGFVLKSFKKPEASPAKLIEDMRMQALCKAFAIEFNGLVKSSKPIDFVTTVCLEDKSPTSKGFLSLERFIEGDYVKYNSNGGFVLIDDDNPFNEIAQAFSHFTFERSWGHLLVTDLQGSGNYFTDPAIQTSDVERFKLSDTNLHTNGFKFFFSTHTCKRTCRKLGLLSKGDMLISGKYTFRQLWPVMDPTVCCASKLCRRIIRVATASKSPAYPGCHWCDECFPQLMATRVQVACAASGPKHTFDVSSFYYVSQGEQIPSVCEEHREEDKTVARVVGSELWEATKSPDAKNRSGRGW
ncbi:eukaroytic elongation factor 2 kinase [Cordyceps militaris]|uniref:Eukaroytic elongation factor 2 kinase n=1 Tax=Cordyceps militaris TaxID=73501 RepID=A0A2H4S7X7_CORMI|nr:eukaroytic elongation factor 2 kinase [Cordyceps militaris]